VARILTSVKHLLKIVAVEKQDYWWLRLYRDSAKSK